MSRFVVDAEITIRRATEDDVCGSCQEKVTALNHEAIVVHLPYSDLVLCVLCAGSSCVEKARKAAAA